MIVKRRTAKIIRKAHRYLGVFLGVQFLMWTISGIYFSWTDLDEVHGDQFLKQVKKITYDLSETNEVLGTYKINSLAFYDIDNQPYYWINDSVLVHAFTGKTKAMITRDEAEAIVRDRIIDELQISSTILIDGVTSHHEYRGRPLPVYATSFNHSDNLIAYVSAKDGQFQRIRHRSWRWFDFLWMTHTMDYQGRDNFNTVLLRGFSLLGLITVLSGFTLWFISSQRVIRVFKKKRK